jgi:hypothetical protein
LRCHGCAVLQSFFSDLPAAHGLQHAPQNLFFSWCKHPEVAFFIALLRWRSNIRSFDWALTSRAMGRRSPGKKALTATFVNCLWPDPLGLVRSVGTRHSHGALDCYWTRRIWCASAFKYPGCYAERFNFRLQAWDLCLKDRDLIFFLFDRVIKIVHWSLPLEREYINCWTIVNVTTGPSGQCYPLDKGAVGSWTSEKMNARNRTVTREHGIKPEETGKKQGELVLAITL